MTNVKIASIGEVVENRQASGVAQYAGNEGDLVGIDANGDVVKADAAGPVKARGVLLGPVTDPADYTQEDVSLVIESNRNLVGEARMAFFEYGIQLQNTDQDWGFTPGGDVYLAEGGGFTQTEPATSGSLIQTVGYAKDDGEQIVLHVDQAASETVV